MWHTLQYSRLSSLNYHPFPALCIPGYLKLNPSADLPKRTLLVIISQTSPQPHHHPDLSPSHRLSLNPSAEEGHPLQRNESFGEGFEVWGLTDSHCLGPDNTVYCPVSWSRSESVYARCLHCRTCSLPPARIHASSLCSSVCYIHPDRPSVLLHPPLTESLSSDTDFVYSAHPLLRLWMSMHACMSSHARRLLLHKMSHQWGLIINYTWAFHLKNVLLLKCDRCVHLLRATLIKVQGHITERWSP